MNNWVITQRHWYWPPWQCYRWGFNWPLIRRGGDEWHNPSWIIMVPLLGAFIWFPNKGFNGRWGEEHVASYGRDTGFEGRVVAGCEGCDEFIADIKEWQDDNIAVAQHLGAQMKEQIDAQAQGEGQAE